MSEFDPYVKGMSAWTEEDDAVLDRYRAWQLELISPYLGRTILEIGAGNGRFARTATEARGPFDRYVALEPGEHFFKGLQKLQPSLPNFEVRNAVIDTLPAEFRGAFDTVLSIHVMEHIKDDDAFLTHCLDKVKPSGYVVALVPALNALYSELDRKIGHFRRYDKKMIRALAERNRAEIVLCRYDNALGMLGWYWFCKVRKIDYHTERSKRTLVKTFGFFSRYVLPLTSSVEKLVSPPIGLNMTVVFRKKADVTV